LRQDYITCYLLSLYCAPLLSFLSLSFHPVHLYVIPHPYRTRSYSICVTPVFPVPATWFFPLVWLLLAFLVSPVRRPLSILPLLDPTYVTAAASSISSAYATEGGSTVRSLHGNFVAPLVHRFTSLKPGKQK